MRAQGICIRPSPWAALRAAVRCASAGLLPALLALLALATFAALLLPVPQASARGESPPAAKGQSAEVAVAELPPEARRTLALIRAGGPFPYDRDGIVFSNRVKLLPARERGWYNEYTVATPGAKPNSPVRGRLLTQHTGLPPRAGTKAKR
jgi:ribonuclease T1